MVQFQISPRILPLRQKES